ncbi:MAG: hypothetical protein R6X08_13130 [Desulfosalsimonadaceae bacterium]
MRKYWIWVFVLALVFGFGAVSNSPAAERNWEQEYIRALEEGKEAIEAGRPEAEVLDKAVGDAMQKGGGGCQVMKAAVDMDYNPYLVLVNIYSHSGVDLDEICMCSTEQGISKAVIARAATNATTPAGDPAFSRQEVSQCQCLQPGLPYTAAAQDRPDPPDPPDPVPPDSASAP